MRKPRNTDKPAGKRNTVEKIGQHVATFADNGASQLQARHGDRSSPDDAGAAQLLESLLKVKEAAEILRCSVATLNRWRLTGLGPDFVLVGRRVRYQRAALAAFIAAATRQSTSDPRGRTVKRPA